MRNAQHGGLQARRRRLDPAQPAHLVHGGDPRRGKDGQHLRVRDEALLAVLHGGLGGAPRVKEALVQRHHLVCAGAHQHLVRGDAAVAVRGGHHGGGGAHKIALAHDAQGRRRQAADALGLVVAHQRRVHEVAHGGALAVLGVVEHLQHAHCVTAGAGVEVVVDDPVLAHHGMHGPARLGVAHAVQHAPRGGVQQVHAHRRLRVARAFGSRGDEDDVGAEVLEEGAAVPQHAHPAVDHLVGGLGCEPHDVAHVGGEPGGPGLGRGVTRRSELSGRQQRVPANLGRRLVHGEVRHARPVGMCGGARVLCRRKHVRHRPPRVHQQHGAGLVVVIPPGAPRQRQHVRGGEGQHHVAHHGAGVQVHHHRARLEPAGGGRRRGGAQNQGMLRGVVVVLLARGPPRQHGTVVVRRGGVPQGVGPAAQEAAPHHAPVAVVQ
mmetsp:Transcript_37693/g.93716  ORF Transcript_37693/g.93716 Transcript_37693/m.93716 type:complete len:434 (+) Transcript_37693:553-1854(+)